jgi:hypothetical protein
LHDQGGVAGHAPGQVKGQYRVDRHPRRFGRGIPTDQALGAASVMLQPQLLAAALKLIGLSQGLKRQEHHAFIVELASQPLFQGLNLGWDAFTANAAIGMELGLPRRCGNHGEWQVSGKAGTNAV